MYVIKEIRDGIYVLSLRDRNVKYFEASWEIEHEGILYNAYVIKTKNGAILIDGRKKEFEKEFKEALEKVLGDIPIKAYIVNHTEPDHSGTFEYVIEKYNPKVYGHPFAQRLLKAFYKKDFAFKPVKHNETIEILGKEVKFYHTLLLHRPDTILTLIDGVLFTGDVLGSYYAYEDPVYSERKEPDPDTGEPKDIKDIFLEEAAEYFSTVIGAFRRHGEKFLNVVKDLKFDVLAPAHGLVRTSNIEYPLEVYRKLIRGEPLDDRAVLILYSTMYGITKPVIEAVEKAVKDKGYEPILLGFDDKKHSRIPDILGNAYIARKIIVVTSAYESELHPRIRLTLELIAHKAPPRDMLIFMSFGRGAAFPNDVKSALNDAKFNLKVNRFSVSNMDLSSVYSTTISFLDRIPFLKL